MNGREDIPFHDLPNMIGMANENISINAIENNDNIQMKGEKMSEKLEGISSRKEDEVVD